MKPPLVPEITQVRPSRSQLFWIFGSKSGRKVILEILGIIAAALCYAYTLAVHIFDFYRRPVGTKLLMMFGLVLGFIVLLTVLRRHWVIEKFFHFPRRTQILLIAALSAVILFLAIVSSYRKPAALTVHSLRIEATGEKYRSAESADISVMTLVTTDGDRVPIEELRITGEWVEGDHNSILLKPGTSLTYQGRFLGGLDVRFIRSIYSGMADVSWDGVEQKVDLYNPDSQFYTLSLPGSSWGRPGLLWGALGAGILIADAFTALTILLFAWFGFVYRDQPRTKRLVVSRLGWLGYALPSCIVWGLSWLAFYPAVMTFDSLDQWAQATTGRYVDIHPILYTLLMRIFALTWKDPAAVALVQILVLALAAAAGLFMLEKGGVPAWACWVASFAFALSPVNLVYSVTLWKDILYSAAVLLFTIFIFTAVQRRGNIKERKIFWVAAGILAGVIPLLRHNGLFAVLATGIVCFLLLREQRREWALVLALSTGLWLFFRGPVYTFLKVSRYPVAETLTIHQMAAYVASDTELSEGEIQYLNSIGPVDQRWYYDCYNNQPTFTGEGFQLGVMRSSQLDFYRLYRSLILRRPDVLLGHLLCSCSMIWRIEQDPGSSFQTADLRKIEEHAETLSSLNLRSQPVLPALREKIVEIEESIRSSVYGWIFWRPAFHLYLVTGILLLVSFRKGSLLFLLPLAPLLFQSLGLLATMPSQAFRYQYAVYLAVSLLWVLVFIPRSEDARSG